MELLSLYGTSSTLRPNREVTSAIDNTVPFWRIDDVLDESQ